MATTSLSRWVAAAIVAAAGSLMAAVPAWAATSTTGIDVSWPQCGHSLPNGEAFAIVGVNGGLANDYNTCLSTEFSYAQRSTGSTPQAPAQLYLNTADPGNVVADWPSPLYPGAYGNKATPDGTYCDYASGSRGPGANSTACAYVYGYDMVQGITAATEVIAGDIPDFNTVTGGQLYSYPTWLDVETGNSWLSGQLGVEMNVADLQGMVDSVHAAAAAGGIKAAPVGIYSTSYQWGQITNTPGSTATGGNLWNIPDWIPGARQKSGAASNCSLQAFTEPAGSHPIITQWFGHPYDGDYSCV